MQTNWQKQALVLVVLIAAISFCITPASAAPPFVETSQTYSNTPGIVFEFPGVSYHKYNTSYVFNYQSYNQSNGVPIINRTTNIVSCVFHLYNLSGDHIFVENNPILADQYDWEIFIAAENFTILGDYQVIFHCNTSTYGGFVASNFEVTNTGNAPPGDNLTIFMIIATIAVIGGMIYLLFYTIQNGLMADVDLKMLGMNVVAYMALFVLLFANQTYIGDALAKTMLDLFISVGALNNVIIPIILFAFSFFKAKGLHKFLKNERIG